MRPSEIWHHWYDNEKMGWYAFTITGQYEDIISKYKIILEWFNDKIENAVRHARWCVINDFSTEETLIKVKFRKEKDYLFFLLTFG